MRTGRHDLTNVDWAVMDGVGNARSVHHAILATLMDIRQELRAVNVRLDCHETISIPRQLG